MLHTAITYTDARIDGGTDVVLCDEQRRIAVGRARRAGNRAAAGRRQLDGEPDAATESEIAAGIGHIAGCPADRQAGEDRRVLAVLSYKQNQ